MRSAWGPTLVRPRTLLAVALGAAAIVLVLSQAAGAAMRFTDPGGDSTGAPDVTNVDVANDVVAGQVVTWIETPNRDSLSATDGIGVFLDTDLNSSTGDARLGGVEFFIDVEGSSAALLRWNGSDFAQVAAPSLQAVYIAELKALRIEIHPNDLGGTRAFNFWILSLNGESRDVAPDGSALWTYSLTAGPLHLSVGTFTIAPKPPRAGQMFTASMFAIRDDTNESTTEGKVTCALRVGGKTVRSTVSRFVGGIATCRWRIPKAARGKPVSGSIAAAFGGATARRAFTARVRR